MTTTTYDINVRYQLEDKSSRGAKKIGTELEKTARHGRKLLSTMKVLAAGALVGFGMRAGKKWLVDYNAEMDGAKIKMQTLLALGTDTAFIDNQKKANALVRQFTKDAAVGVGTTRDYVEFAGEITKPLLDAGASMAQLTNLTKLGVTAAKTFGMAGDVAGRDIQQMLLGNLRAADKLPKLLGINASAWNKMYKDKGPQNALKELENALDTQQMQDAAKAYGDSWDGVTSTLEDNLQRTLGKVGLPLMEKLSDEVKAMNRYFESTTGRAKLEQFIKNFSEGLITGFGYVKSMIELIVENAGLLMNIAKAFVGFKLIQGAGGILSGPLDMMSKYSKAQKKAASATATFADRMTGAANKMQQVGTILGLVYAGASMLAGVVDRRQEAQLKRVERKAQGFLSSATGGEQTGRRAKMTVAMAKKAGIVDPSGQIDLAKFASGVTGAKYSEQRVQKSLAWQSGKGKSFGYSEGGLGFAEQLSRSGGDKRTVAAYTGLIAALEADRKKKAADQEAWATKFSKEIDAAGGLMSLYAQQAQSEMFDVTAGRGFVGPTGEGEYVEPTARATKKNGDVKVYINTIKVAADDPDRFAMRMIGAFKNANTKPVASRIRVPGGRPA